MFNIFIVFIVLMIVAIGCGVKFNELEKRIENLEKKGEK